MEPKQYTVLYVDDIMIATDSNELLKETKEMLNDEFAMKYRGKMSWCL